MELGKKIIKIREDNNLTQEELAEKYFVTRQTISNWENGKTYPDLETIVKISNDFNISLDILLKEDEKMVKKIDKSVKSTKKYKHLLRYIIVLVCILLFIGYKLIMINKYHIDKIDKETYVSYSDELVIEQKKDYDGELLNVDNMSIANYFDDYEDSPVDSPVKLKRDKDDKIIAFYSMGSMEQYVNLLSYESIDYDFDYISNELVKTSESMKNYLDRHDIHDDIDLLNYINENYYFNNSIFTLTSTMKNNSILNYFVQRRLVLNILDFNMITGDLNGYIVNYDNGGYSKTREIHILHNNKQYIILLAGDDITTNEFITKLLQTVKFN